MPVGKYKLTQISSLENYDFNKEPLEIEVKEKNDLVIITNSLIRENINNDDLIDNPSTGSGIIKYLVILTIAIGGSAYVLRKKNIMLNK